MSVESSATEGGQQEPVEGVKPEDTAAATSGADQDANLPAASSPADGSQPESGTGEGGDGEKKPTSILEQIESVLKTDKSESDSPTDKSGEEGPEKPEGEAKAGDGKGESEGGEEAEDDSKLPFHNHPRWKAVLKERDELRTERDELKPAKEAVDRLEGFLGQNQLSVDELNTGLQIMALMRGDPAKALEAITPYVQNLLQATGNTLPDDLAKDVQDGMITEERARELAQARAQSGLHQRQAQDTREQAAQAQVQQATELVGSAGDEWERQWKSSDPDYEAKAARVLERIELRFHRGQDAPRTREDVFRICEEERKAVESEMRKYLPKRPAVNPNPESGGGGGSAAPSQPKSIMDVINSQVG